MRRDVTRLLLDSARDMESLNAQIRAWPGLTLADVQPFYHDGGDGSDDKVDTSTPSPAPSFYSLAFLRVGYLVSWGEMPSVFTDSAGGFPNLRVLQLRLLDKDTKLPNLKVGNMHA